MGPPPGPEGGALSQNLSSTASSVWGPRKAAAIQETVVIAMPIRSCWEKLKITPFLERIRKTMAAPKELIMATISHHAVMRHQNQRSRYSRPVPAPTCSSRLKLSLAVESRKTILDDPTNSSTVAQRPALT